MRVLLITGGWSTERDVALMGAKAVQTSLEQLGHDVTVLDLKFSMNTLLSEARAHDFAFIHLHGSPGEDGMVQAMLETVGCPYQGAGPAASFLALNKTVSKCVFRENGILTADWELVTEMPEADWTPDFSYPIFVKPNLGGSSLGMSMIHSAEELRPALQKVFDLGEEAIIEPLIKGVEVTCPILGDEALPLILIKPADDAGFFDYENKYQPGVAQEICPAPIDPELAKIIQTATLKAHKALGLTGYSRGDFILTPDGKAYLLEVNTLPGMTPNSLVPQSAAEAGMSFDDLIARLIELGMEHAAQK
ncbi:D-alanine--D-alanine ligase [Desulfobaculum bizertense]|uniref:D-alanine--D-alanine ligase family protein n=1 Tax=Desulfobaculum bizertense TaxID=376490 RepID=UPI001F30F7D6|nr:D-alanine--D-alanine ligase [Desulfobaculum bizertense]UIJ39111.1 D-alanine--D-alanine ligase [Desulfobaculum bizertense]